jgi:hypothetical protein
MKPLTITLISSSLLFAACGNQNQETTVPVETAETETTHDHDHESEAIELNEGQKWIVDDSMMVHIRNMETDVNKFSGTTLDDYQLLATSLQDNIDRLTSNCTMTGKAHDELHKWLLPYIDTVDEFAAQTETSAYASQLESDQNFFYNF